MYMLCVGAYKKQSGWLKGGEVEGERGGACVEGEGFKPNTLSFSARGITRSQRKGGGNPEHG